MVSGLFAIPSTASSCASTAGSGRAARQRQFVAGPENLLLTRALAAVRHPAPAVNPLVITGVSGTGKSLVLELLVDEFRRHFAGASTLAVTAVDLARAYAHAVETDSLGEFRHRHSRLHLLAIDDLERIAGKAAAQQELRQLVDSLVSRGSLVVASCRTHPESSDLSPALASRLSAGLVIPLALPEQAARQALLAHFAADADVAMSGEALDRLSSPGAPLPRLATAPQLRRAVIRLGELSRQQERPVDRSLVEEFLLADGGAVPPMKSIVAAVGKHFGVSAGELRGSSRQHSLTAVRGLAMHLAREMAGLSYAQIGRYFGNRDHTTVMYACKKAARSVAGESQLRQTVEALKLQLSLEEVSG